MKTDNYLTLCLEQAAKSPLHYRHGCIVVRGGKVIGQGYNDYRPGFNGGALKHGRIANGSLDGPAMAELKDKLKKQKDRPKQQQQDESTFTPFEGISGGGHNANAPLSMHSEMMALHSALAASSTLSSTTFSFKSAILKRMHVNQVVHHKIDNKAVARIKQINNVQHEQEERKRQEREEKELERLRKRLDRSLAFQLPAGAEKHQKMNQKKEKNSDGKNQHQYQYQYGRCGRQTQRSGPQQQRQPSVSKQSRASGHVIRGYDDDSMVHDVMTTMTKSVCASAASYGKRQKDYSRPGKMKCGVLDEPPQPAPILLPKGQISSSVADRKKHPRLIGADLYVARLGQCKGGPAREEESDPSSIISPTSPTPETNNSTEDMSASSPSLQSTSSSCHSGSLHDELVNRESRPRPSEATTSTTTLAPQVIRASRPCYRCVSYMHSVGIKRVFWTNDAGEWEGGKVRDLVSALNSSMESVANGGDTGGRGGPMGNGVFVTKHEVLMMRRLMGEGGG